MNDLENRLSIFNIKDLEEKEKKIVRIKENILQIESSIKTLERKFLKNQTVHQNLFMTLNKAN